MINCIKWRKPSKESLESALLHSTTTKSGSGVLVKKKLTSSLERGESLIYTVCQLLWCKTSAMYNFKWPRWYHWMWTQEEKHPISSWELVWACSSDSTGGLGRSTSGLGGAGGNWGADTHTVEVETVRILVARSSVTKGGRKPEKGSC